MDEKIEETNEIIIISEADNKLIQMFIEFKREAEEAKSTRTKVDAANIDAYLNKQDFSEKTAGQSQEFIPKTSVAIETLAAFIKKALIAFGDWFDIELNGEASPKLKNFFNYYLNN